MTFNEAINEDSPGHNGGHQEDEDLNNVMNTEEYVESDDGYIIDLKQPPIQEKKRMLGRV